MLGGGVGGKDAGSEVRRRWIVVQTDRSGGSVVRTPRRAVVLSIVFCASVALRRIERTVVVSPPADTPSTCTTIVD